MFNKEYLSLRFLLVAFFVLLATMMFAGLYPFNFFPSNHVQWIPDESGLYFRGAGIAYTDRAASVPLKKAVSVELLVKERHGSKNWGPKEIFSFYDGAVSPSLLVGQWAGRIFIYSRFEKNKGKEWYRLFRAKHRFSQGKTHLVTVTFDEGEKAIYIDGQLSDKKNVALNDRVILEFSQSYLLGNSPRGKNGWNGEIKGLAIYNRILLPDEIAAHSRNVFQKGINGLTDVSDCLALYPFDEGKGNTAKSIRGEPTPFIIPMSLNALALTLPFLPHKDMRIYGFHKTDFIKNIFFFILFGILLSWIIIKKYATGYFTTFVVVTLSGAILSCVIEILQLFIPSRNPGMADICSNIIGSSIGVAVTLIIMIFFNHLFSSN